MKIPKDLLTLWIVLAVLSVLGISTSLDHWYQEKVAAAYAQAPSPPVASPSAATGIVSEVKITDEDFKELEKFIESAGQVQREFDVQKTRVSELQKRDPGGICSELEIAKAKLDSSQSRLMAIQTQYQAAIMYKAAVTYKLDLTKYTYDRGKKSFVENAKPKAQ